MSKAGRMSAGEGGPGLIAVSGRGERRLPANGPGSATAGESLSQEQIEELGARLRTAGSPIDRRLAFTELLRGLTVENAEMIREQIAHLPDKSSEFRDFHYAWGALAGRNAVIFGADTPKADMAPALAGWAGADPAAAMKWFGDLEGAMANDPAYRNLLQDRKIPPAELRRHLMGALVDGLADADPSQAADFVVGLAASGEEGMERMMHSVVGSVLQTRSPEEAADWVGDLPEGRLRSSAVGRVAGHLAGRDPSAAAEWAEGFSAGRDADYAIGGVGSSWAQRDPAAAVAWLDGLPDGGGRTWAMGAALGSWTGRDPDAAGQFINDMSDSPARDSAIRGYASRVVHMNPSAGVEWAGSITDPAIREDALVRTARVYYERNRSEAEAWLATSGLSPEARERVTAQRGREGDRRRDRGRR